MTKMRVAVPVTSLWTDPQSVRKVDRPAVRPHPDMRQWLDDMSREETIALCTEKRLQSQVLFGDDVIVDEQRGTWSKVVVPSQASAKDSRGYPGWIPTAHLRAGLAIETSTKVMVQSKFTMLWDTHRQPIFALSFGTFLDYLTSEKDLVRVVTPIGEGWLRAGDVVFPARRDPLSGAAIVHNADRFMNLDYLWSGLSAYGYDCSGFSYSMMRTGGYLIPRDAGDQSKHGRRVSKSTLRPGDLLFFADDKGKGSVHHVGIYAGDGTMIHSQTPGSQVIRTEIAGTTYEEELCVCRRYWQEEGEGDGEK